MTRDQHKISRATASAIGNVLTDTSLVMTHAQIDAAFLDAGAPGEPPIGHKREKVAEWLLRCNDDPAVDALAVLGKVLALFMDVPPTPQYGQYGRGGAEQQDHKTPWEIDTEHTRSILAAARLEYRGGGVVVHRGLPERRKTLEQLILNGDHASVEVEFERAYRQIESDPPAALTAACALIEAVFKVYIESSETLKLPAKQTVKPLWNVVRADLGFSPDVIEDRDLKAVLSSLAGLVDGIGALRTHASSAHGRGSTRYRVRPRHARLAVNAAHTLAVFVLETWAERKPAS